jgi:V/A-type H+-transporting ATPase subunit I
MQRSMSRLCVIYTRRRQEALLERLQRLGLLHIEALPTENALSALDSPEERQQLEQLLLKTKGLCDLLLDLSPGWGERPTRAGKIEDLPDVRTEIEELEERVRKLVVERRQLQEHLQAAEQMRELIEATEELLKTLPEGAGRTLIAGLGETSRLRPHEIQKTLEERISGQFALAYRVLPQDRIVLLARVADEYAVAVRQYLEAKGLRPLAFPAHIPTTLPLAEALSHLKRDLTEGPQKLHELETELKNLGREHGARIFALRAVLENRLTQLEATARFGYTEYALVIAGWIPEDEYARFEQTLLREFPGIIVRQDPTPAPAAEIPVALHNNRWSRPYELFVSLMGVPKYGTIDPVPFMSFFFPLFFGIIVGDMGYGAVILLLALWLKRRFAHSEIAPQLAQIATHCAISAIFFGAVFAELFGFVLKYPHFPRNKETDMLLLFCVALGATQIMLGFLLGMINALRERHGKHALAKLGAIGALLGLGLIVGVLVGQLPEALRVPSFALLAGATLLLVMSEGFMGILELVGYVSNIVSYARLMGFGIVGLKIAELINEAGHALHNIFLAVIIGIVAHSANLGLMLFESTIQSARLHYVEFFQKFLVLGGRKYEPFREQ